MKLTPQERQAIIVDLTTNCDSWRHPGDEQVLAGFTDAKLVQLKEHNDTERHAVAVANAAVNGFTNDGTAFRVNPETGKWEKRAVANAKKKAADDDDEDEDDDMDDDDDDAVAENARRMKGKKTPTDNTVQRPRTADEWLRAAPADVQNAFRSAEAIVNREKDQIISKLLANVSESERGIHYERLQQRSLDELHYDLSLLPKQPTQEEINLAAGVANRKRQPQRADDDMLQMPTINWESVDGEKNERQTQVANASDGEDEISDEDWLKNAPPRIRAAVQNATVIESRERRLLIDQLTANFQGDEEQEKRLVQRLSTKSLEELRDLLSLSPQRQPQRPSNYFGASAPLANSKVAANLANEDVLPLPTMDWKAAN